MLEKILGIGKLEKKVLENIKKYLQTLNSAIECFKNVLLTENSEGTYCVEGLEREADSLRREIFSTIYEGAFLPYIRPNLCTFIEIAEKAFDSLKICSFEFRYLNKDFFHLIKDEVIKIANINLEMSEILISAFQSLIEKNNIREKNLAIRILEKKVDEIKIDISEKIRKCNITNFWEGENISKFITGLVEISDIIEDASDYLYIIDLSLK